ncbi:uncharacterized protein LOC113768646 [Coffea eugenioides]|uniref:uncharacterized protein LOC113768646 n=1 Tax=Coffea eugenioides TaxID=49369 RepID=UPI000F60A9D8|nr:uncharacterized protein LOC113768646 [Coffea eugenioides]XP_027168888.1 uncharacterized protein LOC113768646 [Coffea eugenioides]
MASRTPREHIEEIRRTKFSIGGEPNPLTEDLHQAVKNLSAELYAKDIHFLMELIQNAEDNVYEEGVEPSLEFVITSKDITATGASATLLIFNNEKGFSPKNIESICSVGRSTKKGNRKSGYIGEKGIGFKSVFLITAQPYIFSNGYQIRFSEDPCVHCNVGYVVPEWVDENPSLPVLRQIYGSPTNLPTTVIVLPLKPDKVEPVKRQLSSIHPEVLLFLSKIKKLSVREDNKDPTRNTVSAISISSETDFVTRKNIDAQSYMLHLSAAEKGDAVAECSYYIWKQRFPVIEECRVERRMDVDDLVIMLALPIGERIHRGTSSPGIYAFLPTEMVTNFPFIIQADFVLSSSRESIRLDNAWNQGILNCVPSAFVNAFTSLVKSSENAPVSSLPPMFIFLPVNASPFTNLNSVRASIQKKLMDENIIPCELYSEQKIFQKPGEVSRLMPAFWELLRKGKKQGVSLSNISTHGRHILCSSFDEKKYDEVLTFLGLKYVDDEWYAKCIGSSNFVSGVSEDLYLDFLLFLAENWGSFASTSFTNIPLLKYVRGDGVVCLCSINYSLGHPSMLLLSSESRHISWLIDWSKEFRCAGNKFFLPKSMQDLIWSYCMGKTILDWLVNQVKVGSVNVNDYASLLSKSLNGNPNSVVIYAHFLYHSLGRNFLSKGEVDRLCFSMPLVDNYGQVTTGIGSILVPAKGSRWLQLIGSNPWRKEGYIELGEEYLHPGYHAGLYSSEKEFAEFLNVHLGASDIPDIPPPDAAIPSVYSMLTKQNAFLLLDWVHTLQRKQINIPAEFLTSMKEGNWVRVSLGGSAGCGPPSQSFLLSASSASNLQNAPILVDIPIIDQKFYGDRINNYVGELRILGVKFEFQEACQYIGNHLMSRVAASNLTRAEVLSILKFIEFLGDRMLPVDNFFASIKGKRWLRTSQGYKKPEESVLFNEDWKAASKTSNIPFLDQDFYGKEILSFKPELKLLGVVCCFNKCYMDVYIDNFKAPAAWNSLSAEAFLFILECLGMWNSSEKLVAALKHNKCLKTNMGFKSPAECYLFDPQWGFLLQVFNSFPIIDETFYRSRISSFKMELNMIGVHVQFEEAAGAFAKFFKQQASLRSISKDTVLSLLSCYRKLNAPGVLFPSDVKKCFNEEKWLRTKHGDYRSPKDCILYGTDWEPISEIAVLPFIDDLGYHSRKAIHKYKFELQELGVVVELRNGAKFVTAGLRLPDDPSSITPAAAYSLLECLKNLQREPNERVLDAFACKVDERWLKTTAGYRYSKECLLFGSEWKSILQQEDGPFIDENFYGSNIASYKKQLCALGVITDINSGCPLMANFLDFHTEFKAITRIYEYLYRFDWKPSDEGSKRIWIPSDNSTGEWVSPEKCVLHDTLGLFGSQLYVLEKHYQKDILSFFSSAFGVKANPSLDDYCKLWKIWVDSNRELSNADCCAFWGFVIKHWNSRTKELLSEELSKIPVFTGSDSTLLFDKHEVFIADDLFLKDHFGQLSSCPLFVWFPQPSLQYLPRGKLLEIYAQIGVRTLSESVEKKLLSLHGFHFEQVNPKEIFIGRGLSKLILGFLASPSLGLEAEKRHEALKCLLNITVLVTPEPINVGYKLLLSSGEFLYVEASRMMRWESEDSKFFLQKFDKSGSRRKMLEYATHFAEVLSEGIFQGFWEKEDHIYQLAELIKLGFMMEFDEAAIDFLMKTKNLEIFLEDEEFLSSAFSRH